MAHIRLGKQRYELMVGDSRIGTGRDATIPVEVAAEAGTLAIITVDARGAATVRRASTGATVSVNGVALGVEPTPLLHGDRIEVAGRQLRFSDDNKAGSTMLMPALGGPVAAASAIRGAAGASGGRLVSLVDGREYAVPAIGGLRIGRDAACDIVVPGADVSRLHAELSLGSRGYVLRDLSTNGVFVNAQRTGNAQVVHRGDVVRIGSEEFRFYAEEAAGAGAGESGGPRPAPGSPRTGTSNPARGGPVGSRRVSSRLGASARPAVAGRPGSAENTAGSPRRASALVWIAAALVIGATLLYVIQDRS